MDESLQLSLLETYCLPILTYAAPAIKLKACQLRELNKLLLELCVSQSVWLPSFESLRVFINGLGRLDFEYINIMACLHDSAVLL